MLCLGDLRLVPLAAMASARIAMARSARIAMASARIAIALLSFAPSVMAATPNNSPFNATYDVVVTAKDITPNLEETFISGTSTDAADGLTKVNGLAYSQTNFTTGIFTSNTDPTTFGLQNFPSGFITFSDKDGNSLTGNQTTTGLIDFQTLKVTSSGNVNITSGSGAFANTIGTINFSQIQPLSLQPGVALKGQTTVNGLLQTVSVSVPEPKTNFIPLVMSAIALGMMLRHRSKVVCK